MSTVDTDDTTETGTDGRSSNADDEAIIRVDGISKRYEGVQALDDVTLDIRDNEILALVGDNGAGKSTLIKSLAGVITPTAGTIHVRRNGRLEEHMFEDPTDARRAGIETVFQDLSLSGQHDVASNVFMGREPIESGRFKQIFGHVDREYMEQGAVEGLDRIGFQVDPNAPTNELSGGQQQAIAVARALVSDPEIVLMDEPTAEVSVEGSQKILDVIENLQEQGHTIVFISHNLQEVFQVADRIAVLRNGQLVDVLDNDGSYEREDIVGLMTGAITGSQGSEDAETDGAAE